MARESKAAKRAKNQDLAEVLRQIGAEPDDGEDGLTRREALLRKLWELAAGGDLRAARLVLEYCDGKPGQRGDAQAREPVPVVTSDEMAAAVAWVRDWEAKALAEKDARC